MHVNMHPFYLLFGSNVPGMYLTPIRRSAIVIALPSLGSSIGSAIIDITLVNQLKQVRTFQASKPTYEYLILSDIF